MPVSGHFFSSPRGSGSDSSHIRPEDDVETVTKKISYASKKLRNVRFNA